MNDADAFLAEIDQKIAAARSNRRDAITLIERVKDSKDQKLKDHAQSAYDATSVAIAEYQSARAEGQWTEKARMHLRAGDGANSGFAHNMHEAHAILGDK